MGSVAETYAAAAEAAELDRILGEDLVRSVYQPIVDLDGGGVVGYEALARGPEGSPLERPDRLFAAAATTARMAELDWACRAAALRGALAAGLDASLFVNVEPETLAAPVPPEVAALLDAARERLQVVVELTERGLTSRPAEVLAALPRLRSLGVAFALDDVGADPRSLALMPFVRPEVVKLDMRLVQGCVTRELAAVVHAVGAEAERHGARVLAEGIETEAHRLTARALGAGLGQGWLLGRPGPLPAAPAAAADPVAARPQPAAAGATPFEVIGTRLPLRVGDKRLLLAISRQLESRVDGRDAAAVVLATVQEARHLSAATAAGYERMARGAALVGLLGAGLSAEPVPGVRGASLADGETLRGEWNVVVLDPHFAAAFTARDLGDAGPDMERRFEFALTYDRALVVEAARTLLARIAPAR